MENFQTQLNLVVIFSLFLFVLVVDVQAEEVTFADVALSAGEVLKFEPVTISYATSFQPKDPFNADESEARVDIVSPDGSVLSVPAFYNSTSSRWIARFAPTQTGSFQCRPAIYVYGKSYAYNNILRFDVRAGKSEGFLRKSLNNPYYLAFDSGRPFFGIGHNIAWVNNSNLSIYRKYFELFRDNGCNLARIWVNTAWAFKVESDALRKYDAGDSEKIDQLLNLCSEYNIYIILVLDSYSSLMSEKGQWDEESWKLSPYNKANGGPCASPVDFFTDPEARKAYKDRLRYIVARWGYSPNIAAFELWNEYDAPRGWIAEMSNYLRSIDPHKHLITTSMGYPWGNNFNEAEIWKMPEIDIIDRHIYGNATKDPAYNIINVNREMVKQNNKPILVGEFGLNANKSDAEIDTEGSGDGLRESLWAGATGGSCATPLNWWWEEYVKGKNLHGNYNIIKTFLDGLDWNSKDVGPLRTSPICLETEKETPSYSSVFIPTSKEWGETTFRSFTIHNNGDVEGGLVNAYLQGWYNGQIRIQPHFAVDYPVDGKFIVYVDMVSQGATLVVDIDWKEVVRKDLIAGPGDGPWKKSLYMTDKKIYQCIYDTSVAVPVSAGKHTIQIRNSGKDWLGIKKIELTNYSGSKFVNARLTGMRVGGDRIIWVKNKAYDLNKRHKKEAVSVIKGATVTIYDTEDGTYALEWYDTVTGQITKRESRKAKGNQLEVIIPDFLNDIACRIKKVNKRR